MDEPDEPEEDEVEEIESVSVSGGDEEVVDAFNVIEIEQNQDDRSNMISRANYLSPTTWGYFGNE